MLQDMFGYIRRNISKWSEKDKQKAYQEAKKIVNLLEKELKIN